MEEIATVSKTYILDRGLRKIRLNFISKTNVIGCIVPYNRL
ncbi:MAG: hypothetical protein QW818_03660 [Candidatus Aenigmatarchaeota archaeon]